MPKVKTIDLTREYATLCHLLVQNKQLTFVDIYIFLITIVSNP